MVRVLITEDSIVVAEILRRVLSLDPEIEVVGWARNGQESIDLTAKLRPDLVTMDIRMPIMDGLQATKIIMRECPTPILVISASVNKEDLSVSFDALSAGALDVIEKPRADSPLRYEEIGQELVRRVKIVSRVRPFRRITAEVRPPQKPRLAKLPSRGDDRVIAIGASTGGPQAIQSILKRLPAELPVPILVVQHISSGFIEGLVEWFNRVCTVKSVIARDGERLCPGVAYFPPDDFHLGVLPGGEIKLNKDAPICGHRPSIDFTMESIAAIYGVGAIGIILTGMGRDGVEGVKAIKYAGGKTMAQDESTSVVFGMPREAIAAGGVDKIVSLEDMADEIVAALTAP